MNQFYFGMNTWEIQRQTGINATGINEPVEFKMLPNLTAANLVSALEEKAQILSSKSFEAPITEVGIAALSVEHNSTFLTLCFLDSLAIILNDSIF